jgi:hypothetical protein
MSTELDFSFLKSKDPVTNKVEEIFESIKKGIESNSNNKLKVELSSAVIDTGSFYRNVAKGFEMQFGENFSSVPFFFVNVVSVYSEKMHFKFPLFWLYGLPYKKYPMLFKASLYEPEELFVSVSSDEDLIKEIKKFISEESTQKALQNLYKQSK